MLKQLLSKGRIVAWFVMMAPLLMYHSSNAQTILISPTNDGGFESGPTFASNGWTVVNYGAATNSNWYLGSGLTNGTYTFPNGTTGNTAYVSNNGGTNWRYNATPVASAVHLFRDVTFPVGETKINLSFKWNANGESTWDDLHVYLCPTTLTPVTGSPSGTSTSPTWAGTGSAVFLGRFNLNTSGSIGNVANIVIPPSIANNCSSSSTMRLVFTWKNDVSGGNEPPAAIDDISLASSVPRMPSSGGTFTIDNTLANTGTNYTSFTEAVNNLNLAGACGFSGSVIFSVSAGQTFAENIPAITAQGTSAFPIVFQKSGVGNNPVIAPPGSTATTDFGLCLLGADYITFDGIDITGGNTVEYGYQVRNASATNGATNNVIKNTTITLSRTNTTSIGIFQQVSPSPTNASGSNSNNSYLNLTIHNVYKGITLTGNSTYPDQGCQIGTLSPLVFNYIGDASILGDIGGNGTAVSYGIGTTNANGIKIFNNIITGIQVNGNTIDGINCLTFSGNAEIYNNVISNLQNTDVIGVNNITGIRITNASTGTHSIKIYNNVISSLSSAYNDVAVATRAIRGLSLESTSNVNSTYAVAHNSVVIDASNSLALSSTCIEISATTTTSPIYTIKNNILANVTGNQSGTAVHFCIATGGTSSIIGNTTSISDYNDLYIAHSGNGYVGRCGGTNRALLANWQGAFGSQDVNSIAINPLLNSSTNLVLLPGTPVGAFASSLGAPYNIDIVNEPRLGSVTLGAYERAVDLIGPSIAHSSPIATIQTSNLSLTAVILDNAKVADALGSLPRIYFKRRTDANAFGVNDATSNGWKWVESSSTISPFNFTVDYSLLWSTGMVVGGDTIDYFIVAQDTTTPVVRISASPSTGFMGTDVANVGAAPTTTYSYAILPAALPPTINSIVHTAVSTTTASIGGTILFNGGDVIISSGVVFSTSPNPTLGGINVVDSITMPLVTNGGFMFNLSGLIPGTIYYYRSYATNSGAIGYGIEDSFKTDPIVSTLPYLQDFESSLNTGWKSSIVSGIVNDWELGTPAKTQLVGAHSGTKAWVTKLSGNYSNSSNCALISPQFDFSGYSRDPILFFHQNFLSETNYDALVLEISINNGPWRRLDSTLGTGTNFNTAGSSGWYNNSTSNGPIVPPKWSDNSNAYSSQVNNWIQSKTKLTGAGGQSNVRFRIHFGSDASVGKEGFAIDDIEIREVTVATVISGTNSAISTGSVTLEGTIVHDGYSTIDTTGIVVSINTNPQHGDPTVIDSISRPLISSGSFSLPISGLLPATSYHYRSYVINKVGISYGADSTFTTLAVAIAPTINQTATDVLTTTATIGGVIVSDGGDPITAAGIVFSQSPNPTRVNVNTVDSTTIPLVTSGNFAFNLVGLLPNTRYYYRAYAVNAIGIAYSVEDSFLTEPIVSTLPYMQDFDLAGNTGWKSTTVSGTINDWELGTPTKTQLSGAYNGVNAWVTKLTGSYSNNCNAALVSPQFDFSGYTSMDPILSFKQNFLTQTGSDGAVLEISINNGIWTKLDNTLGTGSNFNTSNSYSWYNNSSTSGPLSPSKWSGNVTSYSSKQANWIQSQTMLTGAAGQSNVRFRIRFQSDGSSQNEGFSVDDIQVFVIDRPTIQANGITVTGLTDTTATVSWTSGNGDRRIVVARPTATVDAPPLDIMYIADSNYGAGSATGLSNYVVYDGIGTSVTVKRLTRLTDYTFTVYEYNGRYMHVKFLTPGASDNGTTLPVSLTHFEGRRIVKDVLLNWSTASEEDNKGFEVERSADGKTFNKIAFVKGVGTSNKMNAYSLTDINAFEQVQSAMVYYRLKQIDVNGNATYSNMVSVNSEKDLQTMVTISPNPFTTVFTLSLMAVEESTTDVVITDVQGKAITHKPLRCQKGINEFEIDDLVDKHNGVYFIRVTENGITTIHKMIKMD